MRAPALSLERASTGLYPAWGVTPRGHGTTVGVFGPLEMVESLRKWHRHAGVVDATFVGVDDPERIWNDGSRCAALFLATGTLRVNPREWDDICGASAEVSRRATVPVFILSDRSGGALPVPQLDGWRPVTLHGQGHEVVWRMRETLVGVAQDVLLDVIRRSVGAHPAWTPRLLNTVLAWIGQEIIVPEEALERTLGGEAPYVRTVNAVERLRCAECCTLDQFRHDAERAGLDRARFVREVELLHFLRCYLPGVPEWAAWSLGYREWGTLQRSTYRRWGAGPNKLASRPFGEQAERVLRALGVFRAVA